MENVMRRVLLISTFAIAMVSPAVAQKAEIEASNRKFIEAFNKGDFATLGRSTPKMRLRCRQALRWCIRCD
jgi:G:T/U-mismatch repair DNA glycosylase